MRKKILLLFGLSSFVLSKYALPLAFAQQTEENRQLSRLGLQIILEGLKTRLPIPGGLTNLFVWALGLGATAALGIIIFGGISYSASAGNETRQKEAMKWIVAAVSGFAILALGYPLLYIINPDILGLKSPTVTRPGSSPMPYFQSPEDKINPPENLSPAEQKLRNLFSQNGITVTSTGSCSIQGNSNCTSLEGFPEWAAQKLVDFKKECESTFTSDGAVRFRFGYCPITITGGTEVGHQSHGPGNPILDLAKNSVLEKYIFENASTTVQTSLGSLYTIKSADGDTTILNEESHFHITFKK